VITPKPHENDAFLARVFNQLLSANLVVWLRDRVNTNMPSLGMRGPKPTPFDTDEIAAIFRMLVGYINIHDVTFKQYLRAADRLGNFVRQGKSVAVSEERWNKFMMCLRGVPASKANSAWYEGGSVGNDFVPLRLACCAVCLSGHV
jgi:hypothetical protein